MAQTLIAFNHEYGKKQKQPHRIRQ